MYLVLVGSLLFFFVFGLVFLYHIFLWNSDWIMMGCSNARVWLSSFECGFCSGRSAESYFSYTYFGLLVFFVIFDLEISLLLNVPYELCLFKNVLYYLSFLVFLFIGFGVEVYSGYVCWKY